MIADAQPPSPAKIHIALPRLTGLCFFRKASFHSVFSFYLYLLSEKI